MHTRVGVGGTGRRLLSLRGRVDIRRRKGGEGWKKGRTEIKRPRQSLRGEITKGKRRRVSERGKVRKRD